MHDLINFCSFVCFCFLPMSIHPCVVQDVGEKAKLFLSTLDAAHKFRNSVEFFLSFKASPSNGSKVDYLAEDITRFDQLQEWLPNDDMVSLRIRYHFCIPLFWYVLYYPEHFSSKSTRV